MLRKGRSSWGTLETVVRGCKYRIRYMGTDEMGVYRRMCETVHGSRAEASARRAALEVEHSREHHVPTVGQAHDLHWVPWADRRLERGEMSANARQQFDSTWRCHVAPKWTDVSLDAVRPADVEEWLLTKTRAVAMQCKTVLSRVMDRARFNEVTDNDPFSARLDLPSKGTTRPSGAHTPDELREIWLALWGMPMEPAFLLMAFGSCRVGESLGVRALEVTYGLAENSVPVAVVPISRKVGENGSVDPDGDLKTRESVRSVVLCGPMAKRLRDVASGLAAQGVEWLCDDGTGEPMGTHHFRDVFRRAVEGAGCRWMSPQTLRRSWETVAHWTLHLEAEDRERMMGHKLPGVTGAHYDKPCTIDFVRAASRAYATHPFADGWVP